MKFPSRHPTTKPFFAFFSLNFSPAIACHHQHHSITDDREKNFASNTSASKTIEKWFEMKNTTIKNFPDLNLFCYPQESTEWKLPPRQGARMREKYFHIRRKKKGKKFHPRIKLSSKHLQSVRVGSSKWKVVKKEEKLSPRRKNFPTLNNFHRGLIWICEISISLRHPIASIKVSEFRVLHPEVNEGKSN